MYYNKKGEQIDLERYVFLSTHKEYRFIKQNVLKNEKWVSTVWLGLDHSYDDGEPLIFETMVFPSDKNLMDLDMVRSSSEEEAIKNHNKMVKKWSKLT